MQHVKDFKGIDDYDVISSLCQLSDNNFAAGTWRGSLFFFNNFTKSSEVKEAHGKCISSLCHSVANRVMISGSWDETAKLWDYQKSPPECLTTLQCGDRVNSICLLDQRVFVTVEGYTYGKNQYFLSFWDIQTYNKLGQKEVPPEPYKAAFTKNG